MTTNNPVLDKLGTMMPQQPQINPMVQQLLGIYQGLPCGPWDMVFRYIRPEQLTQDQLNQYQTRANQIRPIWDRIRSGR